MAVKISPRFLSLAEAAIYSGVSIMTMRRWNADNRLKTYSQVGRRVLVEVAELDELILASRRQSVEVATTA
jgi:excisionase family DNA binding protein